MKKLKLDLDTVEVQSFETIAIEALLEGTVHGEQVTVRTGCGLGTCVASCCHTDEIV